MEQYCHYHIPTVCIVRLNSQNISIYRTDESGDIIANSDGTNITFNVNPSEKPIEQGKQM